jgi:hypothetical protein
MKRFNLLVLEAAVLLGAVNLNASSIVLSAQPDNTTVALNGTLKVSFNIQGLEGNAPHGPALGGFDFFFGYDSSILANPTVSFGDPILGDQLALTVPSITCVGTACGAPTNLPLELFEVSLDPAAALEASQHSAFTLATISFKAVGLGTSFLTLSNVTLSDENGGLLSDQIVNSSVNVSRLAAAPEPRMGILLPLAAGLACLLFRRRWTSAHS